MSPPISSPRVSSHVYFMLSACELREWSRVGQAMFHSELQTKNRPRVLPLPCLLFLSLPSPEQLANE
ncbi:hypothetical protein RR46_02158 [Papilio xuthus]|uniref:Uncharacterized protein n=1 Tax=Papilio xuthus TaxID=66420 RepID=A0A194QJ51_PAPXU|nr:hypothetical protein RR46_02158 [Papilio xuthus]